MKYLLACFVLFLTVLPTESGVPVCKKDEYLDTSIVSCRSCSSCSKNLIIRSVCGKTTDTVCGPFREFINFQQSPDENGYLDAEHAKTQHHHNNIKHKHHGHNKNGHRSELHILPLGTASARHDDGSSVLDLTSEMSSTGEYQWRTLAMALIGILCIVSVSLVFFVFTVCYIRRKRQAVEKEIIYDPEMIECQTAYLQVQHEYAPSRHVAPLKKNTHALRDLQLNAYDSGSDDSSQAPLPSSQLLGQPVIGPIIVDDYDVDNIGQIVRTTRSSDYVYFNSPENANGEP